MITTPEMFCIMFILIVLSIIPSGGDNSLDILTISNHSDNASSVLHNSSILLPYPEQITYAGEGFLNISRDLLPDSGVLRIWIPAPISTRTQSDIVIKAEPQKWVIKNPDLKSEFGVVYLEVPLDPLDEDLQIRLDFTYISHEKINTLNPDFIAPYNSESDIYSRYTRSTGYSNITSETRELASQIIGDERNPYKKAERIFRSIILNDSCNLFDNSTDNVDWKSRNLSTLFTTLCRSAGIPARTISGMEMMNGSLINKNYAEFYIVPSGWIPVDPGSAYMKNGDPGIPKQDRDLIISSFFGNSSPNRCIIQNDLDSSLQLSNGSSEYYPPVPQIPYIICRNCENISSVVVGPHWKMNIFQY